MWCRECRGSDTVVGDAGGIGSAARTSRTARTFSASANVIGMTAQVFDIGVTSGHIRRLVTLHGVFSFFFNTMTLAATVNVAVTLAGN